jgi:hypothetical protein
MIHPQAIAYLTRREEATSPFFSLLPINHPTNHPPAGEKK